MKPNLAVKIGRLKLKNPVMAASGTFGSEYAGLADIDKLGAIVMKTITLKARTGNPPPRIAETASGMLNSIGLENKGLDDFIKNKAPLLKGVKTAVIASIAGDDEGEYAELAERLDRVGRVDGIEINLSCPNVRHGDREYLIAQDEKAVYAIVNSVRKSTGKTIIAKLAPNVTDIAGIAKAAESALTDAVLLTNTFFGMAVDIDTLKPVLGNISGGLSGPAIKPLVLHMVWKTYKRAKIPIIGCGGIMDYKDALEFIICGAAAVQVGTANFVNPNTAVEIIGGIKNYMVKNRTKDVNKLTGSLNA
ncbi:MAG: dihydroorotate dehydrogenase [Candidatus Omnitrophota bacterium]|nr:dihydroorotate dehydrogenase [Candidatus Omnitrophota bacterium]